MKELFWTKVIETLNHLKRCDSALDIFSSEHLQYSRLILNSKQITNHNKYERIRHSSVISSIWCLDPEPLRTQPDQPHLVDLFIQKQFSCGSARKRFSLNEREKVFIAKRDENYDLFV